MSKRRLTDEERIEHKKQNQNNYKERYPERRKEISKRYYTSLRGRFMGWAKNLRVKYNLTPFDYMVLLEGQKYLCVACGKSFTGQEDVIDHSHKTGRVRGIVHKNCNSFVARVENNPIMIKYLQGCINE